MNTTYDYTFCQKNQPVIKRGCAERVLDSYLFIIPTGKGANCFCCTTPIFAIKQAIVSHNGEVLMQKAVRSMKRTELVHATKAPLITGKNGTLIFRIGEALA